MKKLSIVLFAGLTMGSALAQIKPFDNLSVSASAGTMGLSIEAQTQVNDWMNVRAGLSWMPKLSTSMGFGVQVGAEEEQKYDENGKIVMEAELKDHCLEVTIIDYGKGIENIEKAMEPLYTTKPEWERSGMGFAFMEAFMDELEVTSQVGKGTTVLMRKWIGKEQEN